MKISFAIDTEDSDELYSDPYLKNLHELSSKDNISIDKNFTDIYAEKLMSIDTNINNPSEIRIEYIEAYSIIFNKRISESKEKEVLKDGELYLDKLLRQYNNNKKSKFDTDFIYIYAQKFLEIADNKSYSHKIRSGYLSVYAGLIGLYSRLKRDIREGREAFNSNKEALKIYPCNYRSAIGFAKTLTGIDKSGKLMSAVLSKFFDINGEKFIINIDLAIKHLDMQLQDKKVTQLKKDLKTLRVKTLKDLEPSKPWW